METPDGPGERRCQSCGEALEPEDRYCPECGTRVERPERGHSTTADESQFDTTDRVDDSPSAGDAELQNGGWNQGAGWDQESAGTRQPEATVDGNQAGSPGSMRGLESKLRTAVISGGLGILGPVFLIIGSLVAGLVLISAGIPETIAFLAGTAVGQILGFGGVALSYLHRRGYTWERIRSYLGVRIPSLREFGVIIAGYIGIVITLIAVSIAATLFLPEPAQNEGAQTAIENPELIPAMIVMMLLVVGPFEELLYRGVVQNRLRENFDAIPAIVIASAIFASVHVIALAGDPVGMLVTVTILFFPATIFGYVYEFTGNLVVPALLHGIHNSVLLSLILLGPEMEQETAVLVGEQLGAVVRALPL